MGIVDQVHSIFLAVQCSFGPEKLTFMTSMWVPFIDRVPNNRPFHKCNKFSDLVLTVTVLT